MINDHVHFGGGGDAVFRLERQAYVEAGHEVFTFSQAAEVPHDLPDGDVVCQEGKGWLRAKAGKFVGAPHVYQRLKRLLRRIQPDLIRVHLVSKYPAAIYPALVGYPVIQTLHGPNLFCATSWGNLRRAGGDCELGVGGKCWRRGCVSLARAILYVLLDARVRPWVKRTVDLYHCPSRFIQKKAESLGYGPTLHIPLGIDPWFAGAQQASHDGPPTILYVGAMIEEKGLLFLPEALHLITQRVPEAKLLLCGRGPLEDKVKLEFARRGLNTNVEFKGFVNHSTIVDLYRRAHVFVCPSIYAEQFGLVGPEALACGVPCVGSQVGGIPEWLRDGEWGYLVPPRDPAALAERTTSLLLDRDTRLLFGAKGREFVLKTYDPNAYQKKWLELARDMRRQLAVQSTE
jgi:glycosyltransferase involved in cell wall biosynthesis